MKKSKKLAIRDLTLIAVLTTILFVQEQLLSFIPNVQLTVFLIILYSKKLGFVKTSIITIIHVLLDNLFLGGINLYFTPAMMIGWLMIPLTLCTIFKKFNSNITLAILGIIYSFIYCWIYIIPNMILFKFNFIDYLIADIIFEIVLAISSFVSTLLLYNPMSKLFEKFNIGD
jgi:hypothetical protein